MKRVLTLSFVAAMLCLSGTSASAQTYLFTEVDAATTTFPHTLPNGFEATGSGLTEMTGSYLRCQAGALVVSVPITVPTGHWKLTVHYLHFPGCATRELFLIQETVLGFQGNVNQTGASLNTVYNNSFVSSPNVWYTMEIINDPDAGTAEMRIWPDGDAYPASPLVSTSATGAMVDLIIRVGNSCAPERWIDYLSIDDQSTIPVEASTWGSIKAQFRE